MRIVLLTSLLLTSCGVSKNTANDATLAADAKGFEDAPVALVDAADPNNPLTLFDTGLCVDRACTAVNADVHEYTPQFALWADTATKKRWYWLPPGTQINTTDMDHWDFPVGAKFWKEFTRDGVRVETRLVMRIGAGTTVQSWLYATYQWNDTQTDTTKAPSTGVQNANGTQHDIPSQYACRGCHENFVPTRILGFGAIELDHPAGTPGNADDTTLASLVAAGTLTVNPSAPTAGAPFFPIFPGVTNDAARAGVGYVFANCSHCHNPTSSVHNNVPMELRLTVATVGNKALSPPYQTAVDHSASQPTGSVQTGCTGANNLPAECIIKSREPMNSDILIHFNADPASSLHMPQLGSEMKDPAGLAALTNWISNP